MQVNDKFYLLIDFR